MWHFLNSVCIFVSQLFAETIRPARPGWYEELFAEAMNAGMKSYEKQVNFLSDYLHDPGNNMLGMMFSKTGQEYQQI